VTSIRIVEVEKLTRSKVGMTAAYRAGFMLQEKGWIHHFPSDWSKPAILAFVGDQCVGGLNYEHESDNLRLVILFAWSDRDQPKALAAMLLKLRWLVRSWEFDEISFTCHPGNEAMMKAVGMLGLQPFSMTYHVPKERLTNAPSK
jgi:hypothetical protein